MTDQNDVIAFLSTPAAYGAHVESVERIDTHISIVWLARDRAYKLKRAVRFDYVDFSTEDLRHRACEAELRLNRRTAPSLYLDVQPVVRSADGQLRIGGDGTAVDWLVVMARFDQATLFDRLAEQQRLDVALMPRLADAVVRLHRFAAPRKDRGGYEGMVWVVDGNAEGFAASSDVFGPEAGVRLTADTRRHLERQRDRLDARRANGLVRECHGDLHLRNICLVDGVPTLFDAVEFNEAISCIDVVYDLAFLLMDLWRRRLPQHASAVFNEYMSATGDLDSLALLPLFLSCRAGVRAKTSASAARVQPQEEQRRSLHGAAREYLALAEQLLRPRAPCLIAVGGFSGAGKSTLARSLAPFAGAVPGALICRSDVLRKRLLGVSELTRLDSSAYTREMSVRVYQAILDRARTALAAGHAVVADAVYSLPAEREEIEALARELGVPFVGLWIDGPREALGQRLRTRTGDASDATEEVLDRQIRSGTGPLTWHRLDGSRDAASVADAARGILAGQAAGSVAGA